MAIPILLRSKYVCGRSLKSASQVVGAVGLTGAAFAFLPVPQFIEHGYLVQGVNIIVFLLVRIIIYGLLLYGVRRERPNLLLLWIFWAFVEVLFMMTALTIMYIVGDLPNRLRTILYWFCGLTAIMNLSCVKIVYAYRDEILAEKYYEENILDRKTERSDLFYYEEPEPVI